MLQAARIVCQAVRYRNDLHVERKAFIQRFQLDCDGTYVGKWIPEDTSRVDPEGSARIMEAKTISAAVWSCAGPAAVELSRMASHDVGEDHEDKRDCDDSHRALRPDCGCLDIRLRVHSGAGHSRRANSSPFAISAELLVILGRGS